MSSSQDLEKFHDNSELRKFLKVYLGTELRKFLKVYLGTGLRKFQLRLQDLENFWMDSDLGSFGLDLENFSIELNLDLF